MSVDRPTPKRNGLSAKEHEAVKYKVHHLRNKGLTMRAIAEEVNLSEARVNYILKAKGGRRAPDNQYKGMPFNNDCHKFSEERMMLQKQNKGGK